MNFPCKYYKVAHALIACCKWTEEDGCGDGLWENTAECIDRITAPSLVALLMKVYDAADTECIHIASVNELWPHCPDAQIPVAQYAHTLDGFLHVVDPDEPAHLCTGWSMPIDGKVYCIDIWIIQRGERELDRTDLDCIWKIKIWDAE